MNNLVPNAPAYLAQRGIRRDFNQAVAASAASSQGPHISIRQQRFRLIDAAGNEEFVTTRDEKGVDYLDCVIVNVNMQGPVSKVYYEGAFDPTAGDYGPPDCFSDNGTAPSAQSSKPQSATCASCQHNVWGSAVSQVTGKSKKSCNDVKKIAVVRQENPGMVLLFRIPPASLKNFSAYGKNVASYSLGNRPLSVADVVTRVFFTEVQGVLDFKPVGLVEERVVQAIDQLWTNPDALDDVVGNRDKPYTGPIAVKGPTAEVAAPPAQVAPPPQNLEPFGQVGKVLTPPTGYQQPPTKLVPDMGALTGPSETKKPGRPKKAKEEQAATPTQAPFMQGGMQRGQFGGPPDQQGTQADPMAIPDFLKRQGTDSSRANPDPFGIVQHPQAPNPELAKALEDALNLPT